MCEIRIGDEVERFRMGRDGPHPEATTPDPPVGHVGRVIDMGEDEHGGFWIDLDNWPVDPICGLPAGHFRKVNRHDLQSWLSTSVPNTDRWDKPLPAKKRERAE